EEAGVVDAGGAVGVAEGGRAARGCPPMAALSLNLRSTVAGGRAPAARPVLGAPAARRGRAASAASTVVCAGAAASAATPTAAGAAGAAARAAAAGMADRRGQWREALRDLLDRDAREAGERAHGDARRGVDGNPDDGPAPEPYQEGPELGRGREAE